jgi:hypothetical protein
VWPGQATAGQAFLSSVPSPGPKEESALLRENLRVIPRHKSGLGPWRSSGRTTRELCLLLSPQRRAPRTGGEGSAAPRRGRRFARGPAVGRGGAGRSLQFITDSRGCRRWTPAPRCTGQAYSSLGRCFG